jgi:imidazolonepropionase-like amidohydrolase
MKKALAILLPVVLHFSLFSQNKFIDASAVYFPIDNVSKLNKDDLAMQQFSKNVATYIQKLKDSSLTLKGATPEIQTDLLINCLFAAGDYAGLPAIIHQYRKDNQRLYTQKVGKAYIESYVSAQPFKNDINLFRKKYEETFNSIFQKTTIEDLPRLKQNKTDAETANPERDAEEFTKALPGDTTKSISLWKAIPIILAYVGTKFSLLQDVELSVYKKQIARLENSKSNPIAAKFTMPVAPVAVTHVNIINVKTGKIDLDQTIIIDKNVITNVGATKKIKIPAIATVIDASGKYAMPGMTDGHMHFFQSGGLYTRPDGISMPSIYPYEKDQQWLKDNMYDLMARYLACGITNIIDVGGPMSNFDLREKVNNEISSPNALVTGPLISTVQPTGFNKDDLPIIKASSVQEAREMVKKQLPFKPDFIKIWFLASDTADAAKNLPIVKAAIDESHLHGLKVCVHATEYETAKLAVEAGADILVHSIEDRILDEPMLKLLKNKNIVYIPTLQVYDNNLRMATQIFSFTSHDFTYANPFMLGSTLDLQHIDSTTSGIDYKYIRSILKLPTHTDSIQAKNLLLVKQAGINIVAGTDAGNIGTHHGSSFLKELEMMKSAGLSELDVLRSCTINAAKGFGKENEWGSIENNKIADILLLEKNPLLDLSALSNIQTVIHRGVVINTEELLSPSPETLVQQQLNAYNVRDLEAFIAPYSDSVELYNFPNTLIAKGKEQMKNGYVEMFKNTPDLHCEIVKHIVMGNTIIDHERISGFGNNKIEAIVIYEIEKGKIVRVYFKN